MEKVKSDGKYCNELSGKMRLCHFCDLSHGNCTRYNELVSYEVSYISGVERGSILRCPQCLADFPNGATVGVSGKEE